MSKNRVILLSGWARSGKDTVAEYLEHEYGYEQLSLAAPLKDATSEKYGVPRSWFDDNNRKDKPLFGVPVVPSDANTRALQYMFRESLGTNEEGDLFWTPRALLILEGSVARSVNPNHWTAQLLAGIADAPGNYVVSDVRFPNEINLLQERLGMENVNTVRIHRFLTNPSTDASETSLDGYLFDTVLDNTGDLEDLYDILDLYMSSIAYRGKR